MPTTMRAPLTGSPTKDGRWRIALTLTTPWGGKVRKVIYGKTQRECQANAHAFIAENPGRNAPCKETISALLAYCEAEVWPAHSQRTQEQYKAQVAPITAKFGKLTVPALTTPMIYGWCKDMDKAGVGPRTIQVRRNVLRVALQQAVFLGWRKDNPAKGWEIPVKVKPAAEPIISPSEVLAAIEAEPDPRHKAWVWTLWETGMRPSEATRTGAGNLVKVEGIGWWIDVPGTKTDAAARSVPISEELAQTLLDLGEPWFPYTRRRWTELWHRLQETQGLRAKRTRKKRTPGKELPRLYAIRKARVTAWGDMGLSDAVWANIVGHEDVALTRKVYDTVSRNRIASQMGLKEKE